MRNKSTENSEFSEIISALNPDQRVAVRTINGPILVLAGAGTGKTRVLTSRLAFILRKNKAYPNQILAVTFTNKAAREMRDRIENMIGQAVEGIWLGTFHAIGVRLLRRHAELVNLKSNFTIIDTDDRLRLIKQVIESADLDVKQNPPRLLDSIIDKWKNRGLNPEQINKSESSYFADGKAIELYATYQNRLRVLNACDFGDLLLHSLTILQKKQEILTKYQTQFRFILVDEYQDTNVAQYLFLRLLAQKHCNICCVGDDDQSIYSWRGAEVQNILRFEKDFPGATVVRLEQNYRSSPEILSAASSLISHNDGRLGKTLWTDLPSGPPLTIHALWDGAEEARVIGERIIALDHSDNQLNEIAVLVRAGFQTREFEERFITLGLPYKLIGGQRFYERMEIRDAVAYFRVIIQPDDDLAFERIINKPKRGIGNATMQVLHRVAREFEIPLTRAAWELIQSEELRPHTRVRLRSFLDDLDRWRSISKDMDQVHLAEIVLDESEYTSMWQKEKSPDAAGRLENLKELVRAMGNFINLQGFLEHISLVMENEQNKADDSVSLMTLHAAKGLEFDTVFLPGWEDGIFPHQRAIDEGGNAALEEERRLAYVGITRARHQAIVTFAANRRMFDRWITALPSRFIEELPQNEVARENEHGLYTGSSHKDSEKERGIDDIFAQEKVFYGNSAKESFKRIKFRNSKTSSVEGVVSEHSRKFDYAIGERVFHIKFGYGRIEDIEGNKLEIDFEKAGKKRVVEDFVKPA